MNVLEATRNLPPIGSQGMEETRSDAVTCMNASIFAILSSLSGARPGERGQTEKAGQKSQAAGGRMVIGARFLGPSICLGLIWPTTSQTLRQSVLGLGKEVDMLSNWDPPSLIQCNYDWWHTYMRSSYCWDGTKRCACDSSIITCPPTSTTFQARVLYPNVRTLSTLLGRQ